MNDFSSDYVKKEIEKINVPEEKLDLVIKSSLKTQNKWTIKKKVVYFSSAACLLFSLFIGTTFISPAMASIASKIPYLNQFYESKPIIQLIQDKLTNEGYSVNGVGMSVNPKTISISVEGSKEYYHDVKKEIEKSVDEFLRSKGYDAYKVEVYPARDERIPISEEEENRTNLLKTISDELLRQNYSVLTVGMNQERVEIEIPDTEQKIEEIKMVVSNLLKNQGEDTVEIKIIRIDMEKREQESRWGQITSVVADGLLVKKEFKVTGIGYSVYPEPELTIRTSVKSKDSDAKEHGNKIERTVEEFLKSKEGKSLVKNDSYKIIVLSKDKKKINE